MVHWHYSAGIPLFSGPLDGSGESKKASPAWYLALWGGGMAGRLGTAGPFSHCSLKISPGNLCSGAIRIPTWQLGALRNQGCRCQLCERPACSHCTPLSKWSQIQSVGKENPSLYGKCVKESALLLCHYPLPSRCYLHASLTCTTYSSLSKFPKSDHFSHIQVRRRRRRLLGGISSASEDL